MELGTKGTYAYARTHAWVCMYEYMPPTNPWLLESRHARLDGKINCKSIGLEMFYVNENWVCSQARETNFITCFIHVCIYACIYVCIYIRVTHVHTYINVVLVFLLFDKFTNCTYIPNQIQITNSVEWKCNICNFLSVPILYLWFRISLSSFLIRYMNHK